MLLHCFILLLFLLIDGSVLFSRIESAHLKYGNRSSPSISSKTSKVWSPSRRSHTNVNSLYPILPYFTINSSTILLIDGSVLFPRILIAHLKYDSRSPPSISSNTSNVWSPSRPIIRTMWSTFFHMSLHYAFLNYISILMGPCFFLELKVLTSNTIADLLPPSVPKQAIFDYRQDRVQSSEQCDRASTWPWPLPLSKSRFRHPS